MKIIRCGFALFLGLSTMLTALAQYQKKTLIAHRGASAYAPEHTLAAYRLAMQQGADFVEQDLQIFRSQTAGNIAAEAQREREHAIGITHRR